MKKRASVLTLVLGLVLSCVTARAQTSTTTLYVLNPDTTFEQGCFPPCMCPIMIGESVKGTFSLTLTNSNSLFNTYAVSEVVWLVSFGGTNHVVTGAGSYQIGGEFALVQDLSLYLQIDGGDVQHFDSGLVPVGAPFPEIKVSISLHGMVCYDTVFNVSASPGPVANNQPPERPSTKKFRREIRPNPALSSKAE